MISKDCLNCKYSRTSFVGDYTEFMKCTKDGASIYTHIERDPAYDILKRVCGYEGKAYEYEKPGLFKRWKAKHSSAFKLTCLLVVIAPTAYFAGTMLGNLVLWSM